MREPGFKTVRMKGDPHGSTVLSNLYHVNLRSHRDGSVYSMHVASHSPESAIRKAKRFVNEDGYDVLKAESAGSVIV